MSAPLSQPITSEMVEYHAQHQVEVIPFASDLYPKSLALTPNPPRVLFAKGNLELLKETRSGVAIVGSRAASDYGIKVTEKIAAHYAKKNGIIVSGLARGIDQVAHSACLASNGFTIAVLAHGLDSIYPLQNAPLAASILENKGLLISEYPLGTEPQKHFFVMRNRIQVGLSSFSIIVETKVKSGTMSHAKFCLESNHQLYAVVPHKPISTLPGNFEGNALLIHEGKALPLRSSNDYPPLSYQDQ